MAKDKIFLLLLTFLLLLSLVSADGICELNKENYVPGELMTLQCSCSSSAEENKDGYIVFLHNNGSILKSKSVSSGSCTTSVFGDSYNLPNTLTNYTGVTVFSLNSDGTGTPTNWGNGADINNDNFIINGSNGSDCIIKFEVPENITPVFDLGREASLSIEVEDANSFDKIINARCSLHVENVQDVHIFSVPLNPPTNYLLSTSNGEVAFEKFLDIGILQPNTSYIVKAYCYCPTNSSEPCYLQGNGMSGDETGFKTCTANLIASSGFDYRQGDFDKTKLIYGILFFMVIIYTFAFILRESHPFLALTLVLVGLFFIPLIANFVIKLTTNTVYEPSGLIFYKNAMRILYVILVYVLIYSIYKIFDFFGIQLFPKLLKKLGVKLNVNKKL
jgi:hypothetical protein